VVLGQDHLFLGVRTAHRRAIRIAARDDLPRPDTVDPRDVLRMLLVGRAQGLPFERPCGAQQAFVVQAGDHVLDLTVAVVTPQPGVEYLVARGQDDGPHVDLDLLGLLMQIDGPVLAHAHTDVALLVFQIQAVFLVHIRHERHRLREVYVDGLALRQALVVLVGHHHGAVLHAGIAAGADIFSDVSWLLDEGDVEIPGFPFNSVDLGVGEDLYVGMPVAFDELRGLDAHGAVIGGEGLVELRHLAADGGRLLHQIDLVARGGEIEGGLDTADPSPHDHDVAKTAVGRYMKVLCFDRYLVHFATSSSGVYGSLDDSPELNGS